MPPTSPNSGRPSEKKRVYRPCRPCTRTVAAPRPGEVVCTRMPPISLSIITMSPGVISIFSSISSRFSTSTRIGLSSMRPPVRVADTSTDSSTVGGGGGGGGFCSWAASSTNNTDNQRNNMPASVSYGPA